MPTESQLDAWVREPIETHVREELAPWIPLTFDGVTFEPEDDSGALRQFWARCTILFGDAFEATMGDEGEGENMIAGVVVLDLFGSPGAGRGPLLAKADQARSVFNRRTLATDGDPIEFQPTSGPSKPREEREGWLMVSLRTAFEAHETY